MRRLYETPRGDLIRVFALVVLAPSILAFVSAFSSEKLMRLYQEELGLEMSAVSTLAILIGVPTYLQPLLGALSDLVLLLGYRRRSYFALGALIAALGYGLLSLSSDYSLATVAGLALLTTAGGALFLTTFNAVIVAVGNETGAFSWLVALQYLMSSLWLLLVTGYLRGYVTETWSYSQCFRAASLTCLALLPLAFLIPEQRQARESSIRLPLRTALRSANLWIVIAFIFTLAVTPGTYAARIAYETNALHFSRPLMDTLVRYTAAGILLGIALFGVGARRLSIQELYRLSWIMDCLGYLVLLALKDPTSAKIVAVATGCFGTIYGLCLYALAGRLCPRGAEATVYGLILGSIALGGTIGGKIGDIVYEYFGAIATVHGWGMLIWVGFGCTVAVAAFLPFLPKYITWEKVNRPT